jgi:hypothetical protein
MTLLESHRSKLMEHFEAQASLAGLPLSPYGDVRTLNLMDRLFRESRHGRDIVIEFSPRQALELDHFFKDAERDDGFIALLYIAVKEPIGLLPTLWSMYRDWIHEGRSREYIDERYPVA